jgi:hypothetical protein
MRRDVVSCQIVISEEEFTNLLPTELSKDDGSRYPYRTARYIMSPVLAL